MRFFKLLSHGPLLICQSGFLSPLLCGTRLHHPLSPIKFSRNAGPTSGSPIPPLMGLSDWCPTWGSLTVCLHARERVRTSTTLQLSDLTILRPPPYLSRKPTAICFSNFQTFIQVWIGTKNTYIRRRTELQISLPYVGRARELPSCSYSLAVRGPSSESRLPGVNLGSATLERRTLSAPLQNTTAAGPTAQHRYRSQ